MMFGYLGALLASVACMLLLDWRFRLFFFRDAPAATAVTVLGTVFFLLWDAVGIALGIFLRGESDFATGVVLAPHMPLEEPVFLVFLVICTMVLYRGAAELFAHMARRRAAGPRAAGQAKP